MTTLRPAKSTRMAADDRRVLILDAATEVFGERGYAGTTTDQVATAAGVSQPYVVRMFGTKEKLFLEVLQRDLDRLFDAFRAEIAIESSRPIRERLGFAYVDLLQDRGLLLSLMHGFVLGSDPVIGKVARCGFLDMYRFLKTEAGFTPSEAEEFLAKGMLLNTLVGLRVTDDYDTDVDARELLTAAAHAKVDLLLDVARGQAAAD
ncbi:MAG TPA: helix-turn-helix domain-containing protein [Galbitalea sp.]|nr:helix-turn-helix domain-containing protein [Galbitalea sp.]